MLDAHSGMCFPQLIDAAFKDCPKLPAGKERPQVPGFEEVGMLNAMIWALACFGVVAADIALSVVLFSALGVASVVMGF